MKRDTKRIEQLLANTRKGIKLVREETEAGSGFDHIHAELKLHEQIFASRLTELRAWNAKQDKSAAASTAEAGASGAVNPATK